MGALIDWLVRLPAAWRRRRTRKRQESALSDEAYAQIAEHLPPPACQVGQRIR